MRTHGQPFGLHGRWPRVPGVGRWTLDVEISGRLNLNGKIAIVTGGARGIGAAICRALAREGCDIVAADVLDTSETEAMTRGYGVKALGLRTNVTDRQQVAALVDKTIETFGRIDILVNDAGTLGRTDLEGTTDEIWERDTGVIMKGTYLCTQAVYPHMKAQGGGKIVNVASISGKIGGAVSKVGDSPEAMKGRSGPAYAAVKGGVIAFTKWVAKDGGRYGVYANAVCPGPVSSELTHGFDYGVENQPIARMGGPEDIAEAVVFLASNAANYITGQALNVDGGLVMD
jgi:3-oxoacyl-[acyl-carrier protein] reductase